MSSSKIELEILPCCSARVCLRRLRSDDLEDFQAYRQDPEVARLQGWSSSSDEKAQLFLDSMEAAPLFVPGQWCQLGIAAPCSDRLLGDVGLCLSLDGAQLEFGISLNRAMQGKGYASAALELVITMVFEHSSALRLVAITDVRNHSAQALLLRCGFGEVERIDSMFQDEPCIEIAYELCK